MQNLNTLKAILAARSERAGISRSVVTVNAIFPSLESARLQTSSAAPTITAASIALTLITFLLVLHRYWSTFESVGSARAERPRFAPIIVHGEHGCVVRSHRKRFDVSSRTNEKRPAAEKVSTPPFLRVNLVERIASPVFTPGSCQSSSFVVHRG